MPNLPRPITSVRLNSVVTSMSLLMERDLCAEEDDALATAVLELDPTLELMVDFFMMYGLVPYYILFLQMDCVGS